MLESAEEKRIVSNYKRMIMTMIDEYNEHEGINIKYPKVTNWSLVQDLLWGTNHANMASSIEKCKQIGIDPWEEAFD